MKNFLNPPVGTFRTIFLYVGQGEATLMIIPDGDAHRYLLIDSNEDTENNGTDLLKELGDEIPKGELVFINTHPHNDHVKGVDKIDHLIGEVWETGFEPSKDHDDAKKAMDNLVEEKNVYYLRGTNKINVLSENGEEEGKDAYKIGGVDYQVLSPSSYLKDEVDGDDNKIHEQCGVIRFTYKDKSILITGDSDKKAWMDHITDYHKDVLKSDILSASHHGSRSFFKTEKDDEDPFEEHIENIEPEYLVISAPKESPHDHPHDDAIELYKKYVDEENIFNLGEKEQSLIVDIDSSGSLSVDWSGDKKDSDTGEENKNFSDFPYQPKRGNGIKPYCPYENN